MKILKCLLMIVTAPVILVLTLFVRLCMGLPLAAIWLLGKVQSLKFAIHDWVYGQMM
ncbi:hypothetical protein OCV77_10740 [Suilimivivens aceti]|uniref:1-acyl-sn-glycerol-3-phosphate acyltransferase n=1 Tax=Suilimivivens aceti TaxID=2981774 RepID=A0ABT2T419_9FIRM|nr:hypothetical protein [Suilimivivens aceti]MCU6744968.1 hypothetical protein [Suilimivivens aceti]SCI00764.1 Uncharacterised protein [uncultured Clostridium sp.]